MAPLSEFIWAEEECRSGLPESAIREPYSASPVLPRWEERLVLDLICAAATPQLSLRFPKDVMNLMFGCSEPADILGSMRGGEISSSGFPLGMKVSGILRNSE